MGFKEGAVVVRLVVELREGRAPHRGEKKRSDAKPRHMLRIHFAEFAALYAAFYDGAKCGEAVVDDLGAVEAGELGKIARFGEHDLGQYDAVAGAQEFADGRQRNA